MILAMDDYVTKVGKLDRKHTQIYVPNDYVYKETGHYKNLIFGASVNPNRLDAIQQLHQVHEQGAVLISL